MWNRIKQFFLPPVFEGEEEKTKNARLIYYFLLVIIGVALLYPFLSILFGGSPGSNAIYLATTLVLIAVGLGIFLRFGYVVETGVILCLALWAAFTYGAYIFGGLHDTATMGFLLVIILASIVGGWQVLMAFSGLSLLSLFGLYFTEQIGHIQPDIATPSDAADIALPIVIVVGTTFLLRIFVSYLTTAYEEARTSEASLAKINETLEYSRNELAQQTNELERRARYLEATAAIARDIAAELDPEALLQHVTNLISDQFGFYHTGIFLLDAAGEYAILEAASSEGGKNMLENGHSLQVGAEGIVGYVAQQGKSRVALDTGEDAVYFNNPYLPKTRSEAALPLRMRGQTIGILDVQSVEAEAFNAEDIAVFQTMADQIAIALQNARLFRQAEESLEAQRRAYGDSSYQAWERLSREKEALGYQYIQGKVTSTAETTISTATNLPKVSVPIQLGDRVIGHITAHKTESDSWSSDEVAIMENLSNQLSLALESARLYQDTRLRAAREQLTTEVTSRIRETLNIEMMLKTASDEIRKALNLPEVVIRLGEPTSEPSPGATE